MPLVYLREIDQDTKFAVWRIEESESELLAQLQLDEREKTLLTGFTKGKRRLHWMCTRVLLRSLLQTTDYIDCPSDANGKPYLANFPQKISLTHSFDYAAVMISNTGECGIDMELVKTKVERIAHKFLKPEELAFITHDEQRILQLYACWSAKEAVYKLQGNIGVSFLDNMHIAPFHYEDQGILHLTLDRKGEETTFKVHYEKFAEYMLAYVVE
ncbi:4'-phosphopantetheinyl transferase superfamily protein [Sphingobacteriaceae bacterium WQ 2009]|uniref:4'-phosphopantetheinyl transferase superfamily protein n=1 Tax=Rhinopithecimicrobium faecis TaxID=2820698 RepID=A0A8T4H9L0_9SPHI|nr:4'-phosphopantetheinyl transferase superfamily protein [Sphingobacteriaceae bacterium WQ 2009]